MTRTTTSTPRAPSKIKDLWIADCYIGGYKAENKYWIHSSLPQWHNCFPMPNALQFVITFTMAVGGLWLLGVAVRASGVWLLGLDD
jgi:hypothetical protein